MLKKSIIILLLVCLIIAVIEDLFLHSLVIILIFVLWRDYKHHQKLNTQQTEQHNKAPEHWDNF